MSEYSTDELTDRICWPTREETKNAIIAKLRAADRLCEAAQRKINIQAMDEGLWWEAITASEAYIQNALRELHAIIKQAIAEYKGKEKL